MTLPQALQSSPVFLMISTGLLGLLVGSFLNVVVYRLPIMLERGWKKDCRELLELPDVDEKDVPVFNLSKPDSHCPHCNNSIRAHQNIPILSYCLLRGRCAHCKTAISARYPIVEALTGLISVIVIWHFGYSLQALFALILSWGLITLSLIDFDHQLLPDVITLPGLWLGLLLSLFGIYSNSHDSIIGAIAGYLSLWSVYQLFKLVTGKEGMGFGDFKLLALFGAWLGWQMLPVIILLSSLVGSIIGISLIVFMKRDRSIPIPFGPYLAIAGWLAMIWGDDMTQLYLHSVGLG